MTEELRISIEGLYKVFDKYPLKPKISGCPCCVKESDRSTLHSKHLKDLQEDDISLFAFKAISTWGDVDDFKHYLPRIFELLSTTDFIIDTSIILGKLDYAKWADWKQSEKNAIINFLHSWWVNCVSYKGCFDSEILIGINNLTKDLPKLLELWSVDIEGNSFKCFVDFLQTDIYNISQRTMHYKDLSDSDFNYIKEWINNNIVKLEEGFFFYEHRDSKYAEQISNILYAIERT